MTRLALKVALPEPPQIDTFVALRPIEKVASLQIRDYTIINGAPRQGDPVRVRVADILIPDCLAGDQITGLASIQATSERPYAVEFTPSLRATQSPTGLGDYNLDSEHGYNISPQQTAEGVWHGMHHGPVSLGGHFVVPNDGDWFIIITAYAGGSSLTEDPYEWLALDPIGDLSVQRVRLPG